MSPKAGTNLNSEGFFGQRFEQRHKVDFKQYFKPTKYVLYFFANSDYSIAMGKAMDTSDLMCCLRNSTDNTKQMLAMDQFSDCQFERGFKSQEIMCRCSEVYLNTKKTYYRALKTKSKKIRRCTHPFSLSLPYDIALRALLDKHTFLGVDVSLEKICSTARSDFSRIATND